MPVIQTRSKTQTIKKRTKYLSISLLSLATLLFSGAATAAESQDEVIVEPAPLLTFEELKTLAGPIALYPDDLLAVVLPASTYPLQVVAAARFRADNANDTKEPDEEWDESIVALLNYPEALALLNEDIDWTWELGQAVTEQEEDLMRAVQDVRKEAYAAGNIDSDSKQTVYVKDNTIVIEPADEEIVYVPYYEPAEVVRHQTTRVYHYYPTAYPLYYYPYRAGHRFYDHGFWGISSFFTLSWGHYHLRHYNHGHHSHRFYRHRYYDDHYRYTRHYRSKAIRHHRWAHRRAHNYAYNGHWRPKYYNYGARPVHRGGYGKYRHYDRYNYYYPRNHYKNKYYKKKYYKDRYHRKYDRYYDRKYRHFERKHRKHKRRHYERKGRHYYTNIDRNRSAFRPGAQRGLTPQERRRVERAQRRSERLDEGIRGSNSGRAFAPRSSNRDQNAVARREPRSDIRAQRQNRDRSAERRAERREERRAERRTNRPQERRTARRAEERPNRSARPERRTQLAQRPSVQRPAVRSQRPEVRTQRPAARTQRPNERRHFQARPSREVSRSAQNQRPRAAQPRQSRPRTERYKSNSARPGRANQQARQSGRERRSSSVRFNSR